MKSARGIYYDLNESDYVAVLIINNEEIKFYFSSLFLRRKFLEKANDYMHTENLKISSLYNVNIDLSKFLLISYYKKIEKRGFRVLINNKEIDSNISLTVI